MISVSVPDSKPEVGNTVTISVPFGSSQGKLQGEGMERQARAPVFRARNRSVSVQRKQQFRSRHLLGPQQPATFTAALALTTQRWIFWFSGAGGEVWLHVCWAAVEQPEDIKRKHAEKEIVTGKLRHFALPSKKSKRSRAPWCFPRDKIFELLHAIDDGATRTDPQGVTEADTF